MTTAQGSSRERPNGWAVLVLMAGVLYVSLIVWLAPAQFQGDEAAYLQLADNLTHGFFSPPGQIHLWWGPGYPLVLAPFVALDVPVLAMRLLNAGFMLGASVFGFWTARLFMPRRIAIVAAVYLAVYVPAVVELPYLLTESLALLLASAWMYAFCRMQLPTPSGPATRGSGGVLLGVISAALFAYLAVTKVFFGWVLVASLATSLALLALRRRSAYGRWAAAFGLALLLCCPYLLYTYSVTGRPLYWGTSGGLSLYWMSSPYPGELGDWFPIDAMKNDPRLAPNHAAVYARIQNLNELDRDDVLRAAAIENIASHPAKYAFNWIDNLGRLVLNFPYTGTPFNLRSVAVALMNAPVLVLLAWSIVLMARRRQPVLPGIGGLAMVAGIAVLGSSALSAYLRQLVPLIPWLTIATSATVWPAVAAWSNGHSRWHRHAER
ncbi:MAG: hypothetical protein ACR2IK_14075 [Chloroflexota bacterium]